MYYWATHQGAEIDLVLFKHGRRSGVECKRMDAPTLTPSMRIAMNDLKLDRLVVVYPGERRYALTYREEVVPLVEFVGAEGTRQADSRNGAASGREVVYVGRRSSR
jgi:predicted AAA+ superfamily ATPase